MEGSDSLLDLVGMHGMEMIMQQMLGQQQRAVGGGQGGREETVGERVQAMLAAQAQQQSSQASPSDDIKTFGSSSSASSHSPLQRASLSPPPLVIAADEKRVEERGETAAAAVSQASSCGNSTADESGFELLKMTNLASTLSPAPRDTYAECFATASRDELEALIYSLFVTSRGIGKDGFEQFECLSRTKHKCRYKVRVRPNEAAVFIVEERGVHSHPFDASAFNSQGLPRSIREIVDISFSEGWDNSKRQEAVDMEVARLGLPPNPKMNRQIDNRLSYLRRTKNIAVSTQHATPGLDLAALYSAMQQAQAQQQSTQQQEEAGEAAQADALAPENLFSASDLAQIAQLVAAQQEALQSLSS